MQWTTIAVALALASCSSKTDKADKPADKPAGEPAAKPAKATEVVAPAKFNCTKAIPQAIVDKYFPKWTAAYEEPANSFQTNWMLRCKFTLADRQTEVEYNCGPLFDDREVYLKNVKDVVKIDYDTYAGVGRGGYQSKSGKSTGAIHRTLPCAIEVNGVKGAPLDNAKDAVKDLEAALVP